MSNSVDCNFSQSGKGPGLFLIHGIGAAEDAWRFIVPKLSEYFTVVTYDLRGHGNSPLTNKDFTLDDLVQDLETVRKKTKIEKAHFFGHSLGGMIAPAYAKKFPHNTISLGLLSTVAARSIDDKKKVLNVITKMETEGISKILLTRSIMSNLVLFKLDSPLSIFVIKSKSLTIKFNLSTALEAVFKYFLFTDLLLIAPSSKVKI